MLRKALPLFGLLALAGCATPAPVPGQPGGVPAPRAAPEPRNLTGLTSAALKARFGAPAFTRKDGVTEMWRYDETACHTFFFLEGGRVRHVETLPQGVTSPVDAACLDGLKKPG